MRRPPGILAAPTGPLLRRGLGPLMGELGSPYLRVLPLAPRTTSIYCGNTPSSHMAPGCSEAHPSPSNSQGQVLQAQSLPHAQPCVAKPLGKFKFTPSPLGPVTLTSRFGHFVYTMRCDLHFGPFTLIPLTLHCLRSLFPIVSTKLASFIISVIFFSATVHRIYFGIK